MSGITCSLFLPDLFIMVTLYSHKRVRGAYLLQYGAVDVMSTSVISSGGMMEDNISGLLL